MVDKYSMSTEDNIMYAKRNIVDSIYKESRLEGIAVTFPETQEIYEGRSVGGLSVEDVIKVNNLKHAWQFVFDTIEYPLDLRYVRQLNVEIGKGIVTDAGNLRMSDVSIGGTAWKPPIPEYNEVENDLAALMETKMETTDRAISVMLYVMRSQMFFDGNKRTAQLAANQIMIQNGAGLISIPVEAQKDFFGLLIKYYETGDMKDIAKFIRDTSIDGFQRRKTLQPELSKDCFSKKAR